MRLLSPAPGGLRWEMCGQRRALLRLGLEAAGDERLGGLHLALVEEAVCGRVARRESLAAAEPIPVGSV